MQSGNEIARRFFWEVNLKWIKFKKKKNKKDNKMNSKREYKCLNKMIRPMSEKRHRI